MKFYRILFILTFTCLCKPTINAKCCCKGDKINDKASDTQKPLVFLLNK